MTNEQIKIVQKLVDAKSDQVKSIRSEMAKVIVGQTNLVDRLLIALICQGHVLLEGVPGISGVDRHLVPPVYAPSRASRVL